MNRRRVLFGNEFGGGLGHALRMCRVAASLTADGFDCVIYVRRLAESGAHVVGRGFEARQAPTIDPPARDMWATPAQRLAAAGMDDPVIAARAGAAWDAVLDEVDPAFVVLDSAIHLQLAALDRVPAIRIGNGMTVPAPTRAPAVLDPDEIDPALDARILESLAAARRRRGLPPLAALDDLERGLVAAFAACLAPFDPFAHVRAPADRVHFATLPEPGPRPARPLVYAYLSGEEPETGACLAGLAGSGIPAAVYLRMPEKLATRPGGHALTYLERLPEIGRIADGVSAIVHHGSLGVSEAALAGGVPQIVPTEGHFEWAWNTAVLERLGAGRRTRGAVAFAEALRAAVDDDGWARECRGLAEALERPSVSESESKVRTAAARATAGG